MDRATQAQHIYGLLKSANGEWVPLPKILALGIAQYNARIFELRKRLADTQMPFVIENKIREVDGTRHSWYRLRMIDGSAPGTRKFPE